MSLLDLLAGEHLMFRRILDRLEDDLARPEERARPLVSEGLLLLLPALDRHEEVEALIFERSAYAAMEVSRSVLAQMRAQHAGIDRLRKDILGALEFAEQCPFSVLSGLSSTLIADLRRHLKVEEDVLWPHYRSVMGRSSDHALSQQVRRRVEIIESDLAQGPALHDPRP